MPFVEDASKTGPLEVLVAGRGEPVTVFAHGLASASIDETRPFGSGVRGSRVFLHFRGHGATVGPDDAVDISQRRAVRADVRGGAVRRSAGARRIAGRRGRAESRLDVPRGVRPAGPRPSLDHRRAATRPGGSADAAHGRDGGASRPHRHRRGARCGAAGGGADAPRRGCLGVAPGRRARLFERRPWRGRCASCPRSTRYRGVPTSRGSPARCWSSGRTTTTPTRPPWPASSRPGSRVRPCGSSTASGWSGVTAPRYVDS